MSLPQLDADDLCTLAEQMVITSHTGGARSPWRPNAEQRRYWSASERHRFVFVAKPRQIGITTGVDFEDVVWTAAADAAQNTVRTAVVVDTWDKALERIKSQADFAKQIQIEHSAMHDRIVFPNGSEIVAFSAAGSRVGASLSVQRYHLTELPYWERPGEAFGSLMQSLSLGGRCVIETTMTVRDPFARDLWRARNEFHKLFLPVELHDEYRHDQDELSDDEWTMCQREGFSRKDAAAWWMWALVNKCGGDMLTLMREYPQREEHMFQADAARFIRTTPPVMPCSATHSTHGMDGETYITEIWRDAQEGSGQYLIGVDTAAGKERDRSVVVVVDKKDGRLCAAMVSDKIAADDLARVALDLQRRYETTGPGGETHRANALIEDNGIGEATCQAGARLGLNFGRITTTEESRYQTLIASKRAVESGVARGPKVLAEECDELHRDEHGRFKGRKDLLMAYGFCALRITQDGFKPPLVEQDNRLRVQRRIALEQMRRRVGLR